MNQQPLSPYEIEPPEARRLLRSIAVAALGAIAILVLVVLPAEYGIDPTGLGRALGLTALNAPARTLEFTEVVGGNERYREVELPATGDPIPLPNPAVVQLKSAEAPVRTLEVTLEPGQETEIKAVMNAAQVLLFSWHADGGDVYTDFHGHEPGAGEAFVRYEEQQSGNRGEGSLVAPFAGEHGWFWLNVSDNPVTIRLKVTGYLEDIRDYGILR
jgi:hypothetical protein